MIRVKIEQKQGSVSRAVSVIAPSIERALALAGEGHPGLSVRVLFPIDPETYFASTGNAAEGIDYEAMTADEIEAACEAGLPRSTARTPGRSSGSPGCSGTASTARCCWRRPRITAFWTNAS